MMITIEISKLFDKDFAFGITVSAGNVCSIDWGDNDSESFTGDGEPQIFEHSYGYIFDISGFCVRIETAEDVVTELFLRDAAEIDTILPPMRLKSVDVRCCKSLEKLALPQFSGIDTLDVTQNHKLRNLSAEGASFRNLDLSHNPNLKYLYLSYCRNLETLDLRECILLQVLDIVSTYSLREVKLNPNTPFTRVRVPVASKCSFKTSALIRMAWKNKAEIVVF